MRKIKKMSLGGIAIAGQALGSLANIGIGIGQRKKGKKKYEEGREDFIGNLGASDALASASDEAVGFANLAKKQGDEKSDSALAGLLAATKSGDPRFMQTLGIDQIASDTQERGLLTAQNIASARSPLVEAEEKAKDIMTGLYGQDMAEGTAAFNQGTENIMGGASGLLNMPLDIMTAQTAGANFGFAEGGLIGGGGMSMKGFGGFKKDDEDEDYPDLPRDEKPQSFNSVLDKITSGNASTFESLGATPFKKKFTDEEIEALIEDRSSLANGGTIQQLIAEGGSFVTPGEENHKTQEFDIVDSETGETVAKTTGNERHENTADGLSITNSEQEQGMMDAFSQIRDPKNPTVAEARNAVLAMYKVYGLDQFNNNQA